MFVSLILLVIFTSGDLESKSNAFQKLMWSRLMEFLAWGHLVYDNHNSMTHTGVNLLLKMVFLLLHVSVFNHISHA